ncbi:MAG: zinc-ribbon domain-containing protein, partial [Acidobacteriota bacterium]
MNCTKCGNPVPEGYRFCIHCGQPTGAMATPPQPPQPPQPLPPQPPPPPQNYPPP